MIFIYNLFRDQYLLNIFIIVVENKIDLKMILKMTAARVVHAGLKCECMLITGLKVIRAIAN